MLAGGEDVLGVALVARVAERALSPPAWGRMDRLVALGLPDADAAVILADRVTKRLAPQIEAGESLVALTLRTTTG